MLKSLLRTIASGLRRGDGAPDPSLDEAAAAFRAGDVRRAAALAEGLLRRDPDRHEAWNLLGAIALRDGDEDAGWHHFERAASLAEDNPDYLSNAGEACRRAGRYEAAVERLQAALRLAPAHAAALHSLAMSLAQQWRSDEAFETYRRMLAAKPDFCQGHQGYLYFLNFYRTGDPLFVLSEHRRWASLHADALTGAAPEARLESSRNLTVGYVSADFNRHAVGYFIEPILRQHDRERFRIVLYSNTPRADEVTARFVALADTWRDISALDDAAAASQVRRDGVDILVDLSGHSAGNRLLVFARKPAPLQITYLGYPTGTGMTVMDHRLTDPLADAGDAAQDSYVERLLRLPDSLWCYSPPEAIPDAGDLPAGRNGCITFGSLNHVLKITPKLIALWSRVLHAVPGARLVMAAIPTGEAQTRILAEFERNRIDPQRVRMIPRLEQSSFWALHREIDIAFDGFPCNGGTTSCETLWLGVPLVTLAGDVFLARVGLSLLSVIGLQELVARSEDEFVALAAGLAKDLGRLSALRGSLRPRIVRSPLMDAPRFARALEALYLDAWRERCARTGA